MWIPAGSLPVADNCCCLIKSHIFASRYQMTVLQLAAQPERSREQIIWEDVWIEELIDKTWPHMVSSPLLQHGWTESIRGGHSLCSRQCLQKSHCNNLSFISPFLFFLLLLIFNQKCCLKSCEHPKHNFCFVLFKFSYWHRYSRQVNSVSLLWICWKPHRWWRLWDCLCVAQLLSHN